MCVCAPALCCCGGHLPGERPFSNSLSLSFCVYHQLSKVHTSHFSGKSFCFYTTLHTWKNKIRKSFSWSIRIQSDDSSQRSTPPPLLLLLASLQILLVVVYTQYEAEPTSLPFRWLNNITKEILLKAEEEEEASRWRDQNDAIIFSSSSSSFSRLLLLVFRCKNIQKSDGPEEIDPLAWHKHNRNRYNTSTMCLTRRSRAIKVSRPTKLDRPVFFFYYYLCLPSHREKKRWTFTSPLPTSKFRCRLEIAFIRPSSCCTTPGDRLTCYGTRPPTTTTLGGGDAAGFRCILWVLFWIKKKLMFRRLGKGDEREEETFIIRSASDVNKKRKGRIGICQRGEMEGSVSKVKQMETFPLPREKISLFDSEMMMMARRVQHDVAVTRRDERHFSNNFQVRLEGQDGGRAITHTHTDTKQPRSSTRVPKRWKGNEEYTYVLCDIAWKMFQQKSPSQMKEPLTVPSSAKLNGLLAAFDHLPAQIGWTGHLGRPDGQQRWRTAAIVTAAATAVVAARPFLAATTVLAAVASVQRQRMATGRHEGFATHTHTPTHTRRLIIVGSPFFFFLGCLVSGYH